MINFSSIDAALKNLPEFNYLVLQMLIWMLNCFSVYQNINNMSTFSLAVIWAPLLILNLNQKNDHFNLFDAVNFIQIIIDNYDKVFIDDEIEVEQKPLESLDLLKSRNKFSKNEKKMSSFFLDQPISELSFDEILLKNKLENDSQK